MKKITILLFTFINSLLSSSQPNFTHTCQGELVEHSHYKFCYSETNWLIVI